MISIFFFNLHEKCFEVVGVKQQWLADYMIKASKSFLDTMWLYHNDIYNTPLTPGIQNNFLHKLLYSLHILSTIPHAFL
jgi:hypothetical protein